MIVGRERGRGSWVHWPGRLPSRYTAGDVLICSTSPTGSSTCCHPAFLDMRCGVTQPRPPGETPPQPSRCPPRYPLCPVSCSFLYGVRPKHALLPRYLADRAGIRILQRRWEMCLSGACAEEAVDTNTRWGYQPVHHHRLHTH